MKKLSAIFVTAASLILTTGSYVAPLYAETIVPTSLCNSPSSEGYKPRVYVLERVGRGRRSRERWVRRGNSDWYDVYQNNSSTPNFSVKYINSFVGNGSTDIHFALKSDNHDVGSMTVWSEKFFSFILFYRSARRQYPLLEHYKVDGAIKDSYRGYYSC